MKLKNTPKKTSSQKRYEWILRIECYLPNESRCSYNKRIDSHTTRSTGQPPTVPLHPVIPCFLGTEHQEGVSCPLVVSKRYHICDTKCIFQWYLKKYHICGTKTSIVVSKDTTYVVHFADASKKGLFSDSPFLFFECISTIKTSAETVTSVTCFGSTVILPNDSEWGF